MLNYIYPGKCHLTPLVSPRINHYQSSTFYTLLGSSHALRTTSNRLIDCFHFSVLCFCWSTILTRYCPRSNRPICQLPTLSCSNSNRALALTLWKTCVHFDLSQDGVGKSIQMLIVSISRLVLVCWPSKTIVSIPNPRNHTSIRQLVEQITRTKEFR